MTKTVGMVSLGCDKNRVDAEEILATFKQAGYRIVGRAEDADVLIVNTCAFIDAAKKESIDAVFEYAARKKEGAKLVVTGCLPQRYGADFADAIPEGDVFVGINGYDRIVETVEGGVRVSLPDMPPAHPIDRVLTTPPHYAYLKIADGCNNFCSYCAIPMIRGRYLSQLSCRVSLKRSRTPGGGRGKRADRRRAGYHALWYRSVRRKPSEAAAERSFTGRV